jgi:hypothetical protein
MTFRSSSRQICLGAAALALSGLLVCNAQPGGRQRRRNIEFSAPRSDEVTTNLNQLTSKPDGLKQFEEGHFTPLESLDPQSSLDGVVALPNRPLATSAIQSKRAKELLERRKNWVFMSPEDLLAAPTVEEILKTPAFRPDGQEQKELPAFDRFYHHMNTKRSGADNPVSSNNGDLFGPTSKSNRRDGIAAQEDSNLPSSLKESAEALKKLFGPGGGDSPFLQGATHGNLVDTFGLGDNTLSKEQMQEQKKFRDDYRSVLDPTWHPPAIPVPGGPLAIFADTAASAGMPTAGLPSVSSPALNHGFNSQADILNPFLGPPGLPDMNAQALGQTRPALALPTIESPRVAPVVPAFEAPRRSFR